MTFDPSERDRQRTARPVDPGLSSTLVREDIGPVLIDFGDG
jgi:hypothetical protein